MRTDRMRYSIGILVIACCCCCSLRQCAAAALGPELTTASPCVAAGCGGARDVGSDVSPQHRRRWSLGGTASPDERDRRADFGGRPSAGPGAGGAGSLRLGGGGGGSGRMDHHGAANGSSASRHIDGGQTGGGGGRMDQDGVANGSSASVHIDGGQTSLAAACICVALIAAMNPLVCATLWQIRDWKFAEYTMFQLALSDLSRCGALLWIAAISASGGGGGGDYETSEWQYRLGGAAVALPFVITLVQVSCLSVNKMALVSSRLSLRAERSSWRLLGVGYNVGVWLAALALVAAVAFGGDVRCVFLRSVNIGVFTIGGADGGGQAALFWTLASLIFFVPVLLLTVSCSVILHVARTKAAAAARSSGCSGSGRGGRRRPRSARPQRAVLTIGATVGVFYACNLPPVVVAVLADLSADEESPGPMAVGLAFYLMEASGFVNFILYYWTDRKFRKAAGRLWLWCFARGGAAAQDVRVLRPPIVVVVAAAAATSVSTNKAAAPSAG